MTFENDANYLDQHFLTDEEVIKLLIKEAKLSNKDIVIEIGPGSGNITKFIAPKVEKLYCIELDLRLKPALLKLKEAFPNIELIFGNALNVFIPKCDKIITSLPYSILEPFINKLLRCEFSEAIMLIGSKYASSVNAKTITKLSLLTNAFFNLQIITEIDPKSFDPKPKVGVSLIKLTPKKIDEITDLSLLILRFMFIYQNQKVKNALMEAIIRAKEVRKEAFTKNMAKEKIKPLNIPIDILDKKFEVCTNKDLEVLYPIIVRIFN